jgi:hypothetical protein
MNKRRSKKRSKRRFGFGNLDISDEDIVYALKKLNTNFYVKGGKAISKYIKIVSLDWDLEMEGNPYEILPKLAGILENKTGKK